MKSTSDKPPHFSSTENFLKKTENFSVEKEKGKKEDKNDGFLDVITTIGSVGTERRKKGEHTIPGIFF